MTSCDPAPRDIWLAYVEFADHQGVGKVRPVVILDASGKASVITAKITASANYERSAFVEISDWESCGLRRPSWVQVEPLVEVRRDKLLRDTPLGQLPLSTYELVCAALDSDNGNAA
ncbi:type II toxin-antitoxin system PemK/MazF family toxin [Adlercreutzia sp. R21]|uniref:type II toxin-antitoxin system PemK/MazF family toxin n=1 Tax=Adlercreutzia wanghongyangiae TaxID=3111451 RepID=UPI002DBBE402|nr:type II toxin-antitoxin system PemK/MazF family toxin [Adlercreutzia sp. R21]MEC4184977.1 type II toxin-antitoxin system PemK/MazF family toxin [Adlercreutzia sp. R21]